MRPDALEVLNFKEEISIPSGTNVWETHLGRAPVASKPCVQLPYFHLGDALT
jgi:hypothetical protein